MPKNKSAKGTAAAAAGLPPRTNMTPPGKVSYLPGPGSPRGSAVHGMALLRRQLNLSGIVNVDEVARMATARIRVLENRDAKASEKKVDASPKSPAAQL